MYVLHIFLANQRSFVKKKITANICKCQGRLISDIESTCWAMPKQRFDLLTTLLLHLNTLQLSCILDKGKGQDLSFKICYDLSRSFKIYQDLSRSIKIFQDLSRSFKIYQDQDLLSKTCWQMDRITFLYTLLNLSTLQSSRAIFQTSSVLGILLRKKR